MASSQTPASQQIFINPVDPNLSSEENIARLAANQEQQQKLIAAMVRRIRKLETALDEVGQSIAYLRQQQQFLVPLPATVDISGCRIVHITSDDEGSLDSPGIK